MSVHLLHLATPTPVRAATPTGVDLTELDLTVLDLTVLDMARLDTVPLLFSLPVSLPEVGGVLLVLGSGWLALLALWLSAAVAAHGARQRARDQRFEDGTMTLIDVLDLMRDTIDRTGAPYWPQRRLISEPLINDDVPLVLAWVRAGEPLSLLLTLRTAGFTPAQISRHLSGDAPIDLAAAEMLSCLRTGATAAV